MSGVLVPLLFSAGFALLGSWGLRNAAALVPAHASEERQAKDLRSILRGAKSCLVLAALFAVMGVISVVDGVRGA